MTLDEFAGHLHDNSCILLGATSDRVAFLFVASWTNKQGAVDAWVAELATNSYDLTKAFRRWPNGFGIDYIQSEGRWCEFLHDNYKITFTLDDRNESRVKPLTMEAKMTAEQQFELGRCAFAARDGWERLTSV